ncbi:MAG: 2Fe-2S iron-sulfur cluster-binding protein [Pseudomonadota bacterium]
MSGWRHDTLGSTIDRNKPLAFTFDGQPLTGFAGDTVASALMAAGVQTVGRSFKYHRPRGLWGLGAEEPNAIFDITHNGYTRPNQRGTLVSLADGMEVRSVNTAPTAAKDRWGWLDRLHRFLPAGFYYKTFMAGGWMRWEPRIRALAGLGTLDPDHAPKGAAQINAKTPLMVIGSGPAGLAAARAAAERGQAVWLMEADAALGGSLRWRGGQIDGQDPQSFIDATRAAINAAGGRIFTGTTVWGAFDHRLFAAWQREPQRHWRIRADRVILAAGAIERPIWFANNDLPGVMSAEAALHGLRLFGALPGKQIVVTTANDSAYPVAFALAAAGVDVTIADARPEGPKADGVKIRRSATVTAAQGRTHVTGAVINGALQAADAILTAGGHTPSVHLWCQAGGKLDWNASRDALIPRPNTADMTVVGAANGSFGLRAALSEGHSAGDGHPPAPSANVEADAPYPIAPVRPDPALPGRQWVDLQNDVTLKDVGLAAREGFTSVEHLKRYTTLGMATDQGRTSNFGGLAAMAAQTGRTIPETGTTTYRPPFQPVPLTVLGGPRRCELFNPPKRLALESAHRDLGARFREYGGWLRPAVYGDGDEADLAQQGAATARKTVALFDASPLGKLEVIGPNAGQLLDFTGYVRMSSLNPGRARYGFMLRENGVIFDDGVVLRPAEDRWIVSASSSHVDGVRFMLEDARQDRLARKGVAIHDVTAAWTTLTATGPRARMMLENAGIPVPDMPHMGVVETALDDAALRIARVSFTGDLSYELSVPTHHADALRARLDRALAAVDGQWIGLESVMILRAEKGFILIGKDTDGITMPHDLGWGGPREKRADEYLGKRSLFTPEARSNNRRQLVGLTVDSAPLVTGAHLVPADGPRTSLGFVTSSYQSPVLGRPIALALLADGRARMGQTIGVFNDGTVVEATISPLCAFDPGGERLHG